MHYRPGALTGRLSQQAARSKSLTPDGTTNVVGSEAPSPRPATRSSQLKGKCLFTLRTMDPRPDAQVRRQRIIVPAGLATSRIPAATVRCIVTNARCEKTKPPALVCPKPEPKRNPGRIAAAVNGGAQNPQGAKRGAAVRAIP